MPVSANDVVKFWRGAGYTRWFGRDAAFDAQCREGFLEAHYRAACRELESWMDSAEGAFALSILLDQIPRNVFRGSAHAYATDPLARHYAVRAIALGYDQQTEAALRSFFYLPFEHSEDPADQRRSAELHRTLAGDNAERWAVQHQRIIERFGRFPHRNAALGRVSTADELAYLDNGGFKG